MWSHLLRAGAVLSAVVSGGTLLLHVYDVLDMRDSLWSLLIPSTFALIAIWAFAERRHADAGTAITLGVVGGLLGTLAYDVVRIPFMLLGQRIFVPIRVYGIWLTDAGASSTLTDATGWLYHFSNGITFGVLYAAVLTGTVRRGHVVLAVLWAFTLETIAVLCPFGRIFGVYGAPGPLAIAYLGHLAYGIPLGLVVAHAERVRAWLSLRLRVIQTTIATVSVAVIALLVTAEPASRPGASDLAVRSRRLQPDIVRTPSGEAAWIHNETPQTVSVIRLPGETRLALAPGERVQLPAARAAIYRVQIEGDTWPFSAFVIAEPVERHSATP